MKSKFLILIFATALVAAACNKKPATLETLPPPANDQTPVNVDPTVPPPITESPTPPQTNPPAATPPPVSKNPNHPVTEPPVANTPDPTPPPPVQQTKSFTVTANDSAASPSTITVNKGDTVNLTVKVGTAGVYKYGIEFRSASLSSGAIEPGTSKTITFTANSSQLLQAFWPSTDTKKPATINIVVK